MKAVAFLAVVLVWLLAGCGGGELGETYRAALDDFISVGSTLNAATEHGVSYLDYRTYVAEASGAYTIAQTVWPDEFAPDAQGQFEQAVTGWRLAGAMWKAQIDDEVILSNDPLTQELRRYAGEQLHMTGERYTVSDGNIGLLLRLAGEQFEAGREIILPLLP